MEGLRPRLVYDGPLALFLVASESVVLLGAIGVLVGLEIGG